LLLAQCFEQAIWYLVRTAHFATAVHTAIALQYYGLLHCHTNTEELLIQRDSTSYSIHLQRILSKYIEPWIQSNTEVAFHYLFTQYQPSSTAITSITAASASPSLLAMRDLLLQSKATSLLVGDASAGMDSFSSPSARGGLFFHYFPFADAVNILQLAADYCNQQGEPGDAVALLILAQKSDEAASIAIKELARLASQQMSDNKRSHMMELSRRILSLSSNPTSSSSSSSSLSSSSIASLTLLLTVCQFFDHYHAGPSNYNAALDSIAPLQLFPLHPEDADRDEASMRLSTLPIEIQRILGVIALALMDIYYSTYSSLQSSIINVSALPDDRDSLRRECRLRGQALVHFVSLNGALIGVEVQAKLLRLEALMA